MAKLPVMLARGSRQIGFRGLVHKSGAFAVLSNWGRTEEIVVALQVEHQVSNPLTGEPVQVRCQNGGSLASFTLSAAEVDVELQLKMKELPRAENGPEQIPPRTKKRFYERAGNEPKFDLKGELFHCRRRFD